MGWLTTYGDRQPLLTASEELELGAIVRRWHDHPAPVPSAIERAGRRARDRFVAANIRLVYHVLQRHSSMVRGYEDDAVQAGLIGLLRAIDGFDPTRGYRFSTYAYWWIRQGIQRFIDAETTLIRLPNGFCDRRHKLIKVERALCQRLGRIPSDAELAQETNREESAIATLRRPPTCNRSLDVTVKGSDDLLLLDTLQAEQPDDNHSTIDVIMQAIATLPEQQQQVLHALYFSDHAVSYATLAKQMGIHRNAVSNLRNAAISVLQQQLGVKSQPAIDLSQQISWRQLLRDVLLDDEPDDSRIPELIHEVAVLPDKQQQVLRILYSIANIVVGRHEIAEHLGVQPQTVSYLRRRAIKKLRVRMLGADLACQEAA